MLSLARLCQRQQKTVAAQQTLADIHGWFTEGFKTADLKDANSLLAELEGRATVPADSIAAPRFVN